MNTVLILNQTSQNKKSLRATYCDSFLSRFLGLMFQKTIKENEGVLLKGDYESKINSSIHMFFMNFDITSIWIDKKLQVVDKKIAKRWHPYYSPCQPALYVLETHTERFPDFHIGDQLSFIDD